MSCFRADDMDRFDRRQAIRQLRVENEQQRELLENMLEDNKKTHQLQVEAGQTVVDALDKMIKRREAVIKSWSFI